MRESLEHFTRFSGLPQISRASFTSRHGYPLNQPDGGWSNNEHFVKTDYALPYVIQVCVTLLGSAEDT